jgi:hypothetical protein
LPKSLLTPLVTTQDTTFTSAQKLNGRRKVVTRSPHRSVGIIACSWIQDHPIEYESRLERCFVQRAITFPYLSAIEHQPFKLEYDCDGKMRSYTPDFLCRLTDGSHLVIEVKPKKFVQKYLQPFDAAKQILGQENIAFSVCTDSSLDSPSSSNAALVLRYARSQISASVRTDCLQFVASRGGSVATGELLDQGLATLPDVLYLIGRRELCLPSMKSLDPNVHVSLPQKDIQNGALLFLGWLGTTAW